MKEVHFPLVTCELAVKVVPTATVAGAGVGGRVGDGLGEGVGERVGDGLGEGVGEPVGDGLGDSDDFGEGEGEGEGDGEGLRDGDGDGSCATGTKPFGVGAGRKAGACAEAGTTVTTIEACTDPRVATSRAAPGASPRAVPFPARTTFGLVLVKVVAASSPALAA